MAHPQSIKKLPSKKKKKKKRKKEKGRKNEREKDFHLFSFFTKGLFTQNIRAGRKMGVLNHINAVVAAVTNQHTTLVINCHSRRLVEANIDGWQLMSV